MVQPIDLGAETATTCPYCGVGCGVLVRPSGDGLSAEVRGDPDHPSNFGRLCSKGSALGETLGLEERLLYPQIAGKRVSWDTAISAVASRFRETIAQYGSDSVAFYVSGQLLTEDYYVANKLMKGFIGSANIDTNSRLCMASSVVGYKRAFGSDTVPGCYDDLEQADLIVMVGSNFAWCHPVLHQRVLEAQVKRGTKIIVIDPRQTATTDAADLHLAIKPGGDVALFNWLFWKLADSTAFDAEFVGTHTNDISEALVTASEISDGLVRDLTDLSGHDLEMFYQMVRDTPRTVTIYSQGVNQSSSGSDKVSAIINTHLVTGRIGKPGMGPFSITGQPNAMGGREVGGMASQLAAHMDFAPDDVDRITRYWNAPAMPTQPGPKAVEMFDRVHSGQIKAVWIMATNPVVSLPQADRIREALERCPLVVVSDVSESADTVQYADIRLPATSWGEKTGTVTNSERRISRQRSFLRPPGDAHHDWQAICEVAQAMGYAGFEFDSAADIYREHAGLSGFENGNTRDFDISAHVDISDAEYEQLVPFQWPLSRTKIRPGKTSGADHRFFADGQFYTPDGKARFVSTPFRHPVKNLSEKWPLVLNTGRIRDHWHTMTRTGKTARLSAHIAEPFLEMHPKDATRLALGDADLVRVSSQHGDAILRLQVTDRVRPGEVFAPMHWTARFSAKGRIDALVGPETDPASGQPDSKFTPVAVQPLKADRFGFAVLMAEPDQGLLEALPYWALAKAPLGWRLEFAGKSQRVETVVDGLICPDGAITLDMPHDGKRRAKFEGDKLTALILLSGQRPVAADRSWLSAQIGEEHAQEARLTLLAGRPPTGEATGRMICSCFGVGANAICKAIASGANSVAAIGTETQAGTNCGSCKPELRALLGAVEPQLVAAE